MPNLQLSDNIPLRILISRAGISQGKDWKDPKTGATKKLPPQLWLFVATTEGGEYNYIYMPPQCADALVKAGATAKQTPKGTFYDLPDTSRWWIALRAHIGKESPVTTLTLEDAAPSNAAAAEAFGVTPPAAPAIPAPQVSRAVSGPPKNTDAKIVALWEDSIDRAWAFAGARNLERAEPHKLTRAPGPEFTGDNVASLAATLMIARTKNGV